jgi:hypothetical protein
MVAEIISVSISHQISSTCITVCKSITKQQRKRTNTNTKMKENKNPRKEGDKPIEEIINMM